MSVLVFIKKLSLSRQELKEDVDAHREPFRNMKFLSHKITDVCMQDDAVYIESEVTALEKRWKEVLTTTISRKKSLEENYKLSHKFFNGAAALMKMLDEAEKTLNEEEPIGVDPAHLRTQLKKHKVCSHTLTIHFSLTK